MAYPPEGQRVVELLNAVVVVSGGLLAAEVVRFAKRNAARADQGGQTVPMNDEPGSMPLLMADSLQSTSGSLVRDPQTSQGRRPVKPGSSSSGMLTQGLEALAVGAMASRPRSPAR